MRIILENKDKTRVFYWIEDEEFKQGIDVKMFGNIYKKTKATVEDKGNPVTVYREKK